jgi:hypothetical protein
LMELGQLDHSLNEYVKGACGSTMLVA